MATSVKGGAWTRTEFVDRLREIGRERYHDKHPFHQRMHRGELSEKELRRWIVNRFYYQKSIPIKDAIILSRLDFPEDRRRWIGRVAYHDGTADVAGGIESWIKLGEAAGMSRGEMQAESRVLPGVRFAVDAYVNFCRLQPVHEAIAASLTELFAGDLIAARIAVFEKHYRWVDPAGLEYFRHRMAQAPADAEFALEFVLRSCRDREEQERAVAALRFKCDVLWSMLDAIDCAGSA
ncbi:MAG TPA: pyrroloquinoline-quinone synthase PqqC [Candidatus Obscuribacterales bacterium]